MAICSDVQPDLSANEVGTFAAFGVPAIALLEQAILDKSIDFLVRNDCNSMISSSLNVEPSCSISSESSLR